MTRADLSCKCTRCRHTHLESERTWVPHSSISGATESRCPKCGGKEFFDMSPGVAWCWATGLIEIGETVPEGALKIAEGPLVELKVAVGVAARHGQGQSTGKLLVPGIPEAEPDDEEARYNALVTWLAWCAKGNGKRHRKGVVFMAEKRGVLA